MTKIVVSMVATGADGKYIIRSSDTSPFGYHKIYRVYDDGSYWCLAMINGDTPLDTVTQIASMLSQGSLVEMGDVP